jgi:hypothetical protein
LDYVEELLSKVAGVDWENLSDTERPARPVWNGYGGRGAYQSLGDKVQKVIDEAFTLEEALGKALQLTKDSHVGPYFTKWEFKEMLEGLKFLLTYQATAAYSGDKDKDKEATK